MAFYRGEEGSVKFKNGAGTVAAVASTRSWNFSITKDVLETTAHGATTRAYVGSFIDGNGSVSVEGSTLTVAPNQDFNGDLTVSVIASDGQASGSGTFTLIVTQDGTGSRTISWPSEVDWGSATAPTLTTTAAGVDVFVFTTVDGGSRWYGFTAGQAMG